MTEMKDKLLLNNVEYDRLAIDTVATVIKDMAAEQVDKYNGDYAFAAMGVTADICMSLKALLREYYALGLKNKAIEHMESIKNGS